MSAARIIHVVDDEAIVRDSTELLLSMQGFQVKLYDSAAGFLAAEPEPGCALVDIRMPGMDGLALARAVRAKGWDMPVILISGHMEPSLGVRALRAGAFDVIEKPYTECVLLAAIDRAIPAQA